ncbi:hypothetical protein [uncultured Thiocystis sp.]|jgi:hypothetical protein|uniref:hypothetical protein n=1 Tax=uncultured Thiocystis sp. TaxID=1202134 RepID=UPI0025E9FFBC|nr:hypothetical protein [uncultured Thiocystis sp.]
MKKSVLVAFGGLALLGASVGANAASYFFDGFESTTPAITANGGQWQVFNELTKWKTVGGPGIEVQNGVVDGIAAYDGERKIELDSHPAPGNSAMETKNGIDLLAGSYTLSFWYLGRTATAETNGINYKIFNVDDVDGDNVIGFGTAEDVLAKNWQKIKLDFNLTAATKIGIYFAAVGTDDTYGGLVDNVRLVGTPVPVPAAAWLFGSALMGLVGVARRRSSKV